MQGSTKLKKEHRLAQRVPLVNSYLKLAAPMLAIHALLGDSLHPQVHLIARSAQMVNLLIELVAPHVDGVLQDSSPRSIMAVASNVHLDSTTLSLVRNVLP
jgi:hypothetical protein